MDVKYLFNSSPNKPIEPISSEKALSKVVIGKTHSGKEFSLSFKTMSFLGWTKQDHNDAYHMINDRITELTDKFKPIFEIPELEIIFEAYFSAVLFHIEKSGVCDSPVEEEQILAVG